MSVVQWPSDEARRLMHLLMLIHRRFGVMLSPDDIRLRGPAPVTVGATVDDLAQLVSARLEERRRRRIWERVRAVVAEALDIAPGVIRRNSLLNDLIRVGSARE